MRIVAGRHRGRRLAAPPGLDTRPTADRVRQALFDILTHSPLCDLDGASVLDGFAGSGALGLEALSRGAARVMFLDTNAEAIKAIGANVATLREEAHTRIQRADATRPPMAPWACDLVLLDPPYQSGLAGPCLDALAGGGWLTAQALAVVETALDEDPVVPAGFSLADQRRHGAAKLSFLAWVSASR
jgi:16S rRNA (guanine966-N2)-methyltransferase